MATSLTLRTIAAQSMTLRSVDPVSLTLNAPVAGITPSIDGVPTISGTPKVGLTLTATAATSSGLPTPTDTFQWQRSDDGSTGWANISGAVNTTYTAVSADEGKYLRVVQTATNSVGSATANSASTAQVAPAFTGLLDTYSGAAAAYSLRLLRSDYRGSAIRVRRSDDNEEQDIGFRNNELDTSTLETFSLGSDCFVTTWYDQSGNSNNATNSTAANQPKIVSSGTYLGYIEYLTNTSGQVLESTFSYTSSSAFSAFMVVQNFGNAVFGSTNVGSKYYAVAESGSTSSSLSGFGSVSYYNNGSSIGTTRNDIHNATSSFAELTTLATLESGSNLAYLGYIVYSFNYVRMKEYIIYDNQTISRTGVENNIITHYGF